MNKHIHCPHFNSCSGCTITENVNNPPIAQEAQNFFSTHGFTSFILHTGEPVGWRCRAKLAIRGTSLYPLIGLYQEGTHTVVDIPLCRVHHPSINKAAEILKHWIVKEVLPPYQETTQQGLLRYVQLVVERATARVQVALVFNSAQLSDALKQSLGRLWASNSDLWHSVWVNFNERSDNIIFGKEWLLVKGEKLLWEKLGGLKICFHPSSFGQANLDQFEFLLKTILKKVPTEKKVAEFYAGSGIIGLNLVSKSTSVVCCEVNADAEIGFNAAKEALNLKDASKITFEVGSVAKKVHLLDAADVVIVDPPRKGIDPLLIKALNKVEHPKQLVYVSCGWKSFRNDCEALLQGGWKLQHAEGHLFFPGSNHIEVLAIFVKEAPSKK